MHSFVLLGLLQDLPDQQVALRRPRLGPQATWGVCLQEGIGKPLTKHQLYDSRAALHRQHTTQA